MCGMCTAMKTICFISHKFAVVYYFVLYLTNLLLYTTISACVAAQRRNFDLLFSMFHEVNNNVRGGYLKQSAC